MKNSLYLCVNILLLLIITCICLNCAKSNPKPVWNYSTIDVTGLNPLISEAKAINLDVYIDATTSMQGFTVNPNSSYNKFLGEIETAANTSWEKTSIKYFKFGTRIKSIDRNEFLKAKMASFYSEKGIYEETKIDSVIYKTDLSRLSIVVTDLFQTESDINSIVIQIKNRCFAKNIQIAVMGIQSFYDGKVFDAKVPAYRFASKENDVKTYRPFYAIMFGEPENMLRLFSSLKSKSFINERNFVLISKYLVNKYVTKLTKTKDSKDISVRKSDDGKNIFEFTMKEKSLEGNLQLDVSYETNKYTYHFYPQRLEIQSSKKVLLRDSAIISDSCSANDIKIIDMKCYDEKISAILHLTVPETPGIYSYNSCLQLPIIGGYTIPDWVREFSSENPNPKKDANKTLNFEKFINDLIQANIAVVKPKVAKMYITVKH